MHTSHRTVALFATLALFPLPIHSDVLLVNGPGSDFEDLAQAVAAADDGDLILLRSGSAEAGFVIDGKSLSIVADADAQGGVWSDIVVRNLAASQRVTLDGLFVSALAADVVLTIENNAGAVLIQDSVIQTNSGMGLGSGKGVRIAQSAQVTLVNTTVRTGFPVLVDGVQDGMRIENSFVSVHGGSVTGGAGGIGTVAGGAGIRLIDSSLWLTNTIVSGGPGGASFSIPCIDAGDGGVGLRLEGASSAYLQDTQLEGGAGGEPEGFCNAGAKGPSDEVLGGSIEVLSSPSATLAAESPVRAGEPVALSIFGEPGDAVWVLVGSKPSVSPFFPELAGALLPAVPGALFASLGSMPAGGSLEVAALIGAPPFGAAELAVQTLHLSPLGTVALSHGRHVGILGSGL